MSENDGSFMSLALSGDVLPEEIDDFVDRWHEGPGAVELHEYLGMTWEEYTFWLSAPEYLDIMIAARHHRQPLKEAVNDNVGTPDRLAARANNSRDLAELKRWISQQPD